MDKGRFNADRLSPKEIIDLVHSDSVTAEQLDLLAARTLHLNSQLQQQVDELNALTARIDQRLKELKSS